MPSEPILAMADTDLWERRGTSVQPYWYNPVSGEITWSRPATAAKYAFLQLSLVLLNRFNRQSTRKPRPEKRKASGDTEDGRNASDLPRLLEAPEPSALLGEGDPAIIIDSYRPEWAEYEKAEMAGLRGASKNHYCRRKFQHDVKLIPSGREDRSHVLMNNATQTPLAVLSAGCACVFTHNPHLRQVLSLITCVRTEQLQGYANGFGVHVKDSALGWLDRVLQLDGEGRLAPRLHRDQGGRASSVHHWGQRKLFCAELEFMTLHGAKARTVVYAGAAPGLLHCAITLQSLTCAIGLHLPLLCRMFPTHQWVLVDPAPFRIDPLPNMALHQTLFTDAMAAEYSAADTLFISDIRYARHVPLILVNVRCRSAVSEDEWTHAAACVTADLAQQRSWLRTLRPKVASSFTT